MRWATPSTLNLSGFLQLEVALFGRPGCAENCLGYGGWERIPNIYCEYPKHKWTFHLFHHYQNQLQIYHLLSRLIIHLFKIRSTYLSHSPFIFCKSMNTMANITFHVLAGPYTQTKTCIITLVARTWTKGKRVEGAPSNTGCPLYTTLLFIFS